MLKGFEINFGHYLRHVFCSDNPRLHKFHYNIELITSLRSIGQQQMTLHRVSNGSRAVIFQLGQNIFTLPGIASPGIKCDFSILVYIDTHSAEISSQN